jgi:hypothetical protein
VSHDTVTSYAVGDQFLVPTDFGSVQQGWVRGVIARADGRGVLLGYFFDPILIQAPAEPADLNPTQAFLVLRFLETGLTGRSWPILGPTPDFLLSEWPVPPFRDEDLTQPDHAWQVRFDDAMQNEVSRRSVSIGSAARLQSVGAVSGTVLRQLLARRYDK